ncbi:hypothetical protein HK414_15945 [Ramlibacter terrae]|uniref:Uncharacterized protein n=1 Tax=Ramlibacter terrae TaxID=2732511 RepID=A0ABX6P685_9BURK|nr:hypothetical protein HK414_15945 [Ramlibacter terrae]
MSLTSSGAGVQVGARLESEGGLVNVSAAGDIRFDDGVMVTSINALNNTGAVIPAAGGSVTLSRVEVDGAITITATAGSIVDGLTGDTPNLIGETAVVSLTAGSGIGAFDKHLQTQIGTLAATVTTSGGLFLREATGLRVAGGSSYAINLGGVAVGSGVMSLVTVDGDLVLEDGIRSTGAAGHLRLQAGETGNAGSIVVEGGVVSQHGSISLLALDDIVFDDGLPTSGATVVAQGEGMTLDLLAGNAITMEATAQLSTANGNMRLEAVAGAVALGGIGAGTGRVSIVAGTAIVDAQDDDLTTPVGVNVSAGQLRMEAQTGIGSAGHAIETSVGTLAARTYANGSGIFVNETDGSTLGTVAPVTVGRVNPAGSTGDVLDGASLSGLQSGAGGIASIYNGGNLVIDQAFSAPAGAHLLLQAGGTMDINALVSTGGGNITLLAAGDLRFGAAGAVVSGGGTLDIESSGGSVTMAHGAFVRTTGNNIRVVAAADITAGLLDARTATDRDDTTRLAQASWGSVSLRAGGAIHDNVGETAVDVYASQLRLQAGTSIGSGLERLETEAVLLSAFADTGGVFWPKRARSRSARPARSPSSAWAWAACRWRRRPRRRSPASTRAARRW